MNSGLPSGAVPDVARKLLGWRLVSELGGTTVEVMLTEVEAYGGPRDPASHAYRGRTARNAAMFGPAGHLYVYRSYGIHWCANVVTGGEGEASAILLRGAAIVSGRTTVVERRGRADHLTDGPGKLCQALGISGEHDGIGLADPPVRLIRGALPVGWRIDATPRIGISRAIERPWRFLATQEAASQRRMPS